MCNSRTPIKYNILYYPLETLKLKDPYYLDYVSHRLENIDRICDAVLVYAKNDSVINSRAALVFLIRKTRMTNATVLFETTAFKMLPDELVYPRGEVHPPIRIINVLNAIRVKRYVKQLVTIRGFETYSMLDFPTHTNVSRIGMYGGNVLECEWWFNYYINGAFQCSKGRLMQISGTCYLNSVVNGFILSKNASKIALMYMNRSGISKDRLEQDLLTCSAVPKTEEYFYNLLYTALCKKVKITDQEGINKQYHPSEAEPIKQTQDLLIEYSKLYSNNPSGESGYPFDTLIKILDWMGNGKMIYELSENLVPPPDKDFVVVPRDKCDFLIRTLIQIKVRPFIEFVLILLIPIDPTDPAHMVTGYVCDDYYKIYDSGTNKILDVDWLSDDAHAKITSAENVAWSHTSYQWSNAIFIGIVTCNFAKMIEYNTEGVCN